MKTEHLAFLKDLLRTPSPSGNEFALQRVWLDYTRSFAHKQESDFVGNAIARLNPEAEFQVMLAGHADEIAFMVTQVTDSGFLHLTGVGGVSPKLAPGMQVTVLGNQGPLLGVVGAKAVHQGGVGDVGINDLVVDVGAASRTQLEGRVSVGDYAVFANQPVELLGDCLTARALDNRAGSFLVARVLEELAQQPLSIGVCAVSTVGEETNKGGAYTAASRLRPRVAVACDVTFATDYPGGGENSMACVKLGRGPVLAKGSPVNPVVNQHLMRAAESLQMAVQWEVTAARTGTDADQIRLTGEGVPCALVSLPLRYMHSPVETVNLADLEDEVRLLVRFVQDLQGDETFFPLPL